MDDFTTEVATSAVEQVSKDVYADLAHPFAESTGAVLGLIPRTIRAALSPIEKWVLIKESNLAQIQQALDEKLKDTPADDIVTPEAYVGVPALQAASYCVDNDELRNMYANLLASSMKKQTKPYVHPSYAQIIQQLSPDEAKLLKKINGMRNHIPVIDLHLKTKGRDGYTVLVECFSPFVFEAGCDNPDHYPRYFDNLARLGLIERPNGIFLVDENVYEEIMSHPFIQQTRESYESNGDLYSIEKEKGCIHLTAFGKGFCEICLSS